MGKRAASAAGSPGKRAKAAPKVSPVEIIINALGEAELPKAAREMLCAMAPGCLEIAASARGRHEAAVIGMIGTTIEATEASLLAKVTEIEGPLKTSDADRQALAEALEASKATLSERQAVLEECRKRLADATVAFREAKASVQESYKAKTAGEKDLVAAEAKITEMTQLREDCYETLKAGAWENAGELKRCQAGLTKLGGLAVTTESLMRALPGVAGTPPEGRGNFDHTVLEQFELTLDKALGDLRSTVEAGESTKAKLLADMDAAQQSLEDARASQTKAVEAQKAAEAGEQGVKPAQQQVTAAEQRVADFDEELGEKQATLEDQREELEEFRESVLVPFQQLRDPPPPPMVEDDAAVIQVDSELAPPLVPEAAA